MTKTINTHPNIDAYKFVCPKCGSHSIVGRMGRYGADKYHCKNCESNLNKLYNKKKGVLVP